MGRRQITRASIALILLATTAQADTLCEKLDTAQPGILVLRQGPAECRSSLAMGGAQHIHCAQVFAYRSEAATDAFDAVLHDLTQCLGPTATQTTDQIVNHPDAYDLREFDLDGRGYAVSIKDKGALQQTFVFVRVQMPSP